MDETLDDDWKRWLSGIIAPIIFAGFGIYGIIYQHFDVYISRWLPTYPLNGGAAIAAGGASIAVGVGMFAWYWWEDKDQCQSLRTTMVMASAAVFGVCALIAAFIALSHRA